MKQDNYGEIYNDKKTYKTIAQQLALAKSVIIGWTDQLGTHFDILFCIYPYKEYGNYLQRGLKGNELYVSIMSLGAFGFRIDKEEKEGGYVGKKLNVKHRPTADKLAELIIGVIKSYNEYQENLAEEVLKKYDMRYE